MAGGVKFGPVHGRYVNYLPIFCHSLFTGWVNGPFGLS
jgi:hypothetical protein